MKQKLLSILALLLMAVTGAWADTTVTWTASDMSGIYIDFWDGEAYNNTIKGITVTSSGGGGAGASWEGTGIDLNSGSTTITFTSSVGNIKSIAITAENIEMSSIPSGWTTDYSTLSWSGEASTTVPLPLSGWTEISGISEIVFTIESTVAVTGITLDKTEASMIVGGETLTLNPTVLPAEATDKTVTWTTSDASVATVADGVVTAVGAGTATITATANDGSGVTGTCTVTVSPAGYSVALKEGTDDAANWQGKAGTGEYQALPLTGLKAGTAVTVKYNGTKKVKSVKAVKKAAAPAYTLLSAATTSDCGKVVCAAGHLHDAKTAVPAGCTAVGILGKVTTTGHGLILALQDATKQTWNTINGWTSVDTYAGTTLKVLPDDDARGSLTSYTTLGSTAVSNWAVAQKSDYEAIFTNLGSTTSDSDGTTYDSNVDAYITTGVGGTAISDESWSATEYDSGRAWDFQSRWWAYLDKDYSRSVRPVLAF